MGEPNSEIEIGQANLKKEVHTTGGLKETVDSPESKEKEAMAKPENKCIDPEYK
jgi:hypothetical protein